VEKKQMCLNSKEKECKVAKEAITCYKVVMKVERDNMPALVSTIYDFLYKIGESYEIGKGESFPLKGHHYTAKGRKNEYFTKLNHGFHSYKRLKDAKGNCNYDPRPLDWRNFLGEVILKCEIPAGARYWTGNTRWYDDEYAEYCSDQIRVVAWKLRDEKNWRKKLY
jgi:hypothetical protein